MAILKDVATAARVSILTAYQALSNSAFVDDETRQLVIDAAVKLGYRLNVTIKDVADAAGVSTATVSYVLNDSAQISGVTRQKVLDAVAALGYRPNSMARNLKTSATRMIGYAWHDVLPGQINAVLDRFIYCMALAAESNGYHVLTFTQPNADAVKTYEELINSNKVDGFILSNTNRHDSRIRRLMAMKVPFAAFGRSNDEWDFPYVDVDGRSGLGLAVEHLVAQGHEKIGLLGWPEGSLIGDDRFQGYVEAMSAQGIKPRPAWTVRSYNTVADGREAARQLISLPASQRPTAITCVSDTIAVGAMSYLEGAGLRVGTDVALTGFDDYPMSEFLRPSLTSLRQPIEQLANQVVELLMAEIENRPVPQRQILLAPTLVVRASSSRKFT
jgi:DNA-binding LacI/PurR family transcriptional regulator